MTTTTTTTTKQSLSFFLFLILLFQSKPIHTLMDLSVFVYLLTGSSENGLLSMFMKVYLPGGSGDDLELPISCNSFIPKSLPRSVTVRSVSGKMWRMALIKCCGDDDERYALVDGWKRIAKDEDLNGGDFLAFEFDGSRSFNFCIYDVRTTCKRTRTSSLLTKKSKIGSVDNEEEEEESRSGDDVVVLEDDNDDVDLDDDVEVIDMEESNDDVDERRYLDECENPCFEMTINPKKKSQLHIPAYIIKDYDLNFRESITVVDPLARKFGTLARKIKIQTNGSVFVKGFGSVIRRNKVKITDKLIFELKKSGSNKMVHTIKLYIISE
ncbi:unnamed protein product [Cochlearia groenlandica]